MRGGVCHLINALATANVSLDEGLQFQFYASLQENFKHPSEAIQQESVKAFRTFCATYFNNEASVNREDSRVMQSMHKMIEQSLTEVNISITRGYNMAFGVLSKDMINKFGYRLIQVLIANSKTKGTEADDAETRQQAMRSLLSVV